MLGLRRRVTGVTHTRRGFQAVFCVFRFPADLLFTSSSGELWRMVRIGGQPLGFGKDPFHPHLTPTPPPPPPQSIELSRRTRGHRSLEGEPPPTLLVSVISFVSIIEIAEELLPDEVIGLGFASFSIDVTCCHDIGSLLSVCVCVCVCGDSWFILDAMIAHAPQLCGLRLTPGPDEAVNVKYHRPHTHSTYTPQLYWLFVLSLVLLFLFLFLLTCGLQMSAASWPRSLSRWPTATSPPTTSAPSASITPW